MQDLSRRVPGLSLPSMSGGNTIDDLKGHDQALSAVGSPSVNPIPDKLNLTPLPQSGTGTDPARLIGGDGGPDTRPGQAAVPQAGYGDHPGPWRWL